MHSAGKTLTFFLALSDINRTIVQNEILLGSCRDGDECI